MGESKSDYEILTLLAERLGMKENFTEGNSEDDWARLFYESSDLAKTLSWEEFEKKGYHIIPCPGPEEYKSAPGLRWYAEGRADDTADTGNPKRGTAKANELGTYTGKIEFASESLRQNMPDDKERPVCSALDSLLGGIQDRTVREVSAADHSAAPAFQLPHPLRQSHYVAQRDTAAPRAEGRLLLVAGAHSSRRRQSAQGNRRATSWSSTTIALRCFALPK